MDKFEIQKLRDLSIVGVAQRLGLRVNSRRMCLCPFHDDHHPSMSLGRKNHYRCFVCDAHGDVIDLVMRFLNKTFNEACRWLADESNIILTEYEPRETRPTKPFDAARYSRFFERPFLNVEARRFLYDERRIDPRVVRWCRLTSWKDKRQVPWLQIPYYDREGRLVGVQNRNLAPPKSPKGDIPRFRFPQGSQCGIYNLPVLNLLRPGEELWITEGTPPANGSSCNCRRCCPVSCIISCRKGARISGNIGPTSWDPTPAHSPQRGGEALG